MVIAKMSKIIIKNGLVFDPINNIEGEKKDILIENGIITDRFTNENNLREIDASGKTVIPAALDIHAHVASQQVNWLRLLGSGDSKFKDVWQGFTLRKIARDYIKNGYCFILEANVFPSLAKQTIFDFTLLPVLDKAMLLNVSNLMMLEYEHQKAKIEDMAVFISDLLTQTKGFGLKVYNPYECEDWNFGILRDDLTKSGRLYNCTPLEVYENLTRVNEYLKLPHSIHAHIEGYETEQAKLNLTTILDKIKSVGLTRESSNLSRTQIFHLAHAAAYNVDGDNSKLINFLNNSPNIDLDLGMISFNQINPLITSDRHLINYEFKEDNLESSNKLITSAIEFEGDSFATLRTLSKQNKLHCIMWLNAIDLTLNVKNKWQIQLSLNYPNYGDINDIPDIATWLMSSEARRDYLKDFNFQLEHSELLSFNDFIIISRASPAKALGLGAIKGNLGSGADGDINIIDLDINDIDTSKDHELIKKAFENINFVIKAGEIIKNQENIDLDHQGKIFWSEGEIKRKTPLMIMKLKKEFYEKYYSIFYDTLKVSVDNKYLRKIN